MVVLLLAVGTVAACLLLLRVCVRMLMSATCLGMLLLLDSFLQPLLVVLVVGCKEG
jgi:hypothetical protein